MMTPASRLVLTAAARGALLDAAASPAAVRACPAALLPAPQPASWRSFAAAVPSPAAGAPLQEPAFTHAQMPPRAHEHPKFPNTAYSTATLGVRADGHIYSAAEAKSKSLTKLFKLNMLVAEFMHPHMREHRTVPSRRFRSRWQSRRLQRCTRRIPAPCALTTPS